MEQDETKVVEDTTETTSEEAEVEQEAETTEEPEDTKSEDNDIDWKERALKAEKAIEKAKKKEKTSPKDSIEDLTLARLEARGLLHEEDQNYVLKYAKVEGIDPIKALEDDFVKDRLTEYKRKRASVEATPKSNNRTNTSVDEVSVWVKKFKVNGVLPDNNPALTSKILRALKNGA
jgi:hypothetical protein